MGNKLLGTGFTIAIESETPATYTTIADAVDISYSSSVDEVEVTTLASTAKEYKPGLMDGGSFSFECRYDIADASQAYLYTKYLAKTVKNWKITDSADTPVVRTYEGFMTGFDVSGVSAGSTVSLSVTVKVTGVPS